MQFSTVFSTFWRKHCWNWTMEM